MFELFYHCQNCGDGSSHVVFHLTKDQAIKADEEQPEGFAESSVGSIIFKIENDNLYYSDFGNSWTKIKVKPCN